METPAEGYSVFREFFDIYGPHNGVNPGVQTGRQSGIFVIDLDMSSTKNGIADFERWMATVGLCWNDLATLSVTTGGGGCHLVYRYPEGVERIPSLTAHPAFGTAVDVKGDGGYVVVAPGFHASGRWYEWRQAISAEAVRPAPPALIAAVTQARPARARPHSRRSSSATSRSSRPVAGALGAVLPREECGPIAGPIRAAWQRKLTRLCAAIAIRPYVGPIRDLTNDQLFGVARGIPHILDEQVVRESVFRALAHRNPCVTEQDRMYMALQRENVERAIADGKAQPWSPPLENSGAVASASWSFEVRS
jgi:hypothetical protein